MSTNPFLIIIGCVIGAIIVAMLVGITRMLLESRRTQRQLLTEVGQLQDREAIISGVRRTRIQVPTTTTMTVDHSLPPQHENCPCVDVEIPEEVKQIRFIRIRKKA